jgi:CRISPR-associated protein Csd2
MSNHLTNPALRHDFVMLFDVADGNPNGDPDAGNLPRVDPETMQGLVTDVCLKRKVRNYVDATRPAQEGFRIYVQNKGIALNDLHGEAYEAKGIKATKTPSREQQDQVRQWMCEQFFDIRTFGAVMTTGVNCGQVRGPVQLTFARSIDPVVPLDIAITRVAVTKPEDTRTVSSDDDQEGKGKQTEMGRKAILPYGLYLGHGFVNPQLAKQTGFSDRDLETFWTALQQMWELDHSASRGMMGLRGLYVFSHENPLGNAPSHALFDRITVQRREGIVAPRRFNDYTVSLHDADLPSGVALTRVVG